MALVEDYSVFMPDFGVDCTIDGETVRGIFDHASADAFGLVNGTKPILLLPSASLGSAAAGSAITVGGVSFTIAEVQPDGTGMSRLVLES